MIFIFLALGALLIFPVLLILINKGTEEQFTKINRLIGSTWGLFALSIFATESDALISLIKLNCL